MTIKSVHHVQITVHSEVEAACRHFYGSVLRFVEIEKPLSLQKNGGAWYRVGACELHLSIESSQDNRSSKRHLCYLVDDLQGLRDRLTQCSVEIIEDNQPVDDWIRFYARDPGGNRLEFAQLRRTEQ